MTRRHWKIILNVGLAGLLFEFVAFSDFGPGARADDLQMLQIGGGASKGIVPPNIVFIFDTSGSMNNLICHDLTGTDKCSEDQNTTKTGPNSSQVCYNTAYAAAKGIDRDIDGIPDPYQPLFNSDGYTWNPAGGYDTFDQYDGHFDQWITHRGGEPWDIHETGVGETTRAKIEDVINKHCERHENCNTRSRCIYSLRTQGYFWEAGSNCTPSGDPMNICGGGSGMGLGYKCDQDSACTSTQCSIGDGTTRQCTCGECDDDADCSGNCVDDDPECAHWYCDDSTCTTPAQCTRFAAGQIGSCCDSDSDCTVGECDDVSGTCGRCDSGGDCTGDCIRGAFECAHSYCEVTGCEVYPIGHLGAPCTTDADCDGTLMCKSSVCSTCVADSDCGGGTDACVNTDCDHYYCSETHLCTPGSGGEVDQSCTTDTNGSTEVYLGDWLNFYPPKHIALLKAFKDAINNMTGDARMGNSDFTDWTERPANIGNPIKPPCSQAKGAECLDGTAETVCFNPSNANLLNWLDALEFTGNTPLAKALDNVGRYFAEVGGVDTPVCDYAEVSGLCSTDINNYAILISDGTPNGDATGTSDIPWTASQRTMSDGYYNADGDWVDDVAKALAGIDHRTDIDNIQAVRTYSVSFGLTDPSDSTKCHGIMQEAAVAGNGVCFPATTADELRRALKEIILQIENRARGFTAPATAATRHSSSESLSTAVFRPSTEFPLWEGHIFGLQVCDESLGTGCECEDPMTVCVLDSLGDPVRYDSEGYLISKPYWDAALCLAKDPANPPPVGLGPDQENVNTSLCYVSPTNRNIYTAVDSDGDGDLDIDDGNLAFTAANVTAGSEFLTQLNTGGDITAAQEVVNFYRGFDTGDYDGDLDSTEPRNLRTMLDPSGELVPGWWVLGDVFHSIPNVVTRPTGKSLGYWGTTASYLGFKSDNDARIKTILFGANDGMVHAIHAGAWDSDDEAYDNGLGKELWAFVSPEMLSELKDLCNPSIAGGCGLGNHRYLVDGSVMVRDIWTGGAGDNKMDAANKSLWKTVAIYGHRRGGSTYVALDVTDVTSPLFLWQFPQPGSSEESMVGQSWLDTFPAPASIGPLWVEDAGGNEFDKWVVLLSGGYDPTDGTGNALFILDAYTGETIWSVTQTSSTGDDTDYMAYSFPATPVYYSRAGGGTPLIAGIVAADHGGQIWHIPTTSALDLSSPSLTPEIVFRTTDPLIPPDGNGGDDDGELDIDEYQTKPFFFAPTLTRMQGRVRVIIGTGDRDRMIPQGVVSPLDGSPGTACNNDGQCAANHFCVSKRCSTCEDDADCTSPATCITDDTGCLHSYCSDEVCVVQLDTMALSTEVNDEICNHENRIYSLNLAPCSDGAGGYEPCTEADLQQVTIDLTTPTNSVYANHGSTGWYYVLDPGEKVATPFEILAGYAMYTTFYPTTGCNRDASAGFCDAATMGEARLYARHYITGRAMDWDDDGTITAGEAVVALGSGVPTAPAVSVALSDGNATPTLMAGGSDTGLEAKTAAGLIAAMAKEILRFPVSKKIHDLLHD